MKKNELKDLQTDVKLLLECLGYQKNDVNAVKQALVTLSTILHDSIEAKDEFQEMGGLEQVLSLITTSKQHEVVEAGLYCLGSAVEKNVYSQKLLTNASVFTFLHGILSTRRGMWLRKKQTASFLILCLVTNNGFGQNLVRQSSCLQDILNLVRSAFPRSGRMDLNFFEGNEESMYDLWTSLLSAACASINNPMNEENQRMCASLLPYLFNLLTSQSDYQIIRPILSFIGHTVASHSCNQDRVRKCVGIEILVCKLKSLQKHIETDSSTKLLAVQLLFTLDACISENELSSKKFGELDGINVVILMLNKCCLDVGDRIQIILTLAHAVDAYAGNEKYIKECHGIAVLIQQLTTTDDEELNKVVKYLLHMCVSKEENVDTSCVQENHTFLSQLDSMKRLGDMQMLEKISELDNKLECLRNKNPVIDSFEDVRGSYKSSKTDRITHLGHMDDTSTINSSLSHLQDQSQTPREKSLLEQLIKEKVEKERLEKLNQGLQETLIRNHAERFQQKNDSVIISEIENDTCVRNRKHKASEVQSRLKRNGYELDNQRLSNFSCDFICRENNSPNHDVSWSSVCKHDKPDIQGRIHKHSEVDSKFYTSYRYVNSVSEEGCSGYSKPNVKHTDTEISNTSQAVVYSAVPLDLSNHSQELKKINPVLPNDSHCSVKGSNSTTSKADISTSSCNVSLKRTDTIQRNAEIQCGTPFVLISEQQNKIDSAKEVSNCMSDCSAQTDFVSKQNVKMASCCNEENISRSNIILVPSNKMTSENCMQSGIEFNKATTFQNDCPCSIPKHNPNSPRSRKSDCFFIKPIARAPKGKLRVAPLLGSISEHGNYSSQHSVISFKSSAMSQDSDMLSEFDLDLMKNVQKKPGLLADRRPSNINPVSVVKSQNNVRCIDRYVEQQVGNAADKWQVHPVSPSRKTIQPVRPAFSDCGTRRFAFTTSSAVQSPTFVKRRSVDDSGIHSPFDELNVLSWGSPIDSDIDGFRSCSDVSEEVPKPNINSDVLRSSKKKLSKTDACPGCVGPYFGGLELNSRTYNIILETDPNTCSLHRKFRQIERNYIHKQRGVLKSKLKGRFHNDKSFSVKKKSELKEGDKFAFTSDSVHEISPISAENPNAALSTCKSAKQRRQRTPFTKEEEANILQGVERLGKYWNQILITYKFHPSRTNVDLMCKYKRMRAAYNQGKASTCKSIQTKTHRPFSMCEERRLRRGITKCGYNWKTILKSFTFSDGRTTDDLRNKWRSIHGRK